MSVHDSSNIEMVSNVDPPERHSEDSALDSTSKGEHSVIDPGSGDHADSNPESNSGSSDSDSEADGGSSSDSKGSDDSDKDVFGDMFSARKTHKPTTKKQESRAQSSSRSQSCETESQKWAHTPSPENDPHPDKPDWKKKKATSRKSETPKGPSKVTPKAVDKIAQEVGEDIVWKFQEEEDQQERQSRSKKSKKDSDWKKEQEEEYQRQKKKKKKKKRKKERSKKLRRLSAGSSSNNWKPIKEWPRQNSFIQFGLKSIVRSFCTVSLSLFADPERILRRFYVFAE